METHPNSPQPNLPWGCVTKKRVNTHGFSLLEVAIAIAITALCLIPMLGLLPTGLNQVKTSISKTEATDILTAINADIRSSKSGARASYQYNIPFPTKGNSAQTNIFFNELGSVVPEDRAKYKVFINVNNPNNTPRALIQIWNAKESNSPFTIKRKILENNIAFRN